jgi:VWFA-related protein
VRPVTIDVIVTDARGARVSDLKADDFQLVDEAAPVAVDSAKFVVADGQGASGDRAPQILTAADERAAAGREGARLFAIFIDEYHITDGPGLVRLKTELARFIDSLGPRDLVVLGKPLDSILNLRLTADHEVLTRQVELLEARRGDYTARNDFERNYIVGGPQRIDAVRSQIATSVLDALASHLDGLGAGRKAIIVVSEGFAGAPLRRGESLPTIESVTRAANKASASIYPIDPRMFDAGGAPRSDDGTEMLKALASDTNGQAMFALSDLAPGMKRIADDASGYYMLTFTPPASGGRLRFHPVTVQVNRPKVAVVAQKGYWPLSGDDLLREELIAVALGTIAKPTPLPITHASPLIRPWFGIARGPGTQMEIGFVWEPAPRVPGARVLTSAPSTLTLKAMKMDGTVFFQTDVEPLAGEAVFEAEPGRYRVELAIHGVDSRLLDTDSRELVVGKLAGAVALGTPEVLRSRTARDYRALETSANPTPAAAREFSRTERLLIRIPAYGSGDGFTVSADLQNWLGKEMRNLEVAPAPVQGEYDVDLPLAGLAPGDYAVAVVAKSSAGNAAEVVKFKVTP